MNYGVHGILQARILEWVAFPFPGDLPNPGIEPGSPILQADSLQSEPPGKPISLNVFIYALSDSFLLSVQLLSRVLLSVTP